MEDRFWAKVMIGPECWRWTASIDDNGYGRFWIGRRPHLAHRVSYELMIGPIPEGSEMDHLCRNRACVRPDHLEPVSHAENVRRGIGPRSGGLVQGRRRGDEMLARTHCPSGHEYSAENTRRHKGKRYCRACARAATRRYLERKRSVA